MPDSLLFLHIVQTGGIERMKYKLVNVMEERVMRAINDTLPQLGCCTCDRCKADVAAYTLSRVTPNYIQIGRAHV